MDNGARPLAPAIGSPAASYVAITPRMEVVFDVLADAATVNDNLPYDYIHQKYGKLSPPRKRSGKGDDKPPPPKPPPEPTGPLPGVS